MTTRTTEGATEQARERVFSSIAAVAREIGAEKAILFGSYARGTETSRSDIDVVFIQETDARFVERPAHAMELLHDLLHGRGIDVIVYTPGEFERMSRASNLFVRRLKAEGKVVYES